MKKPPKIAKWLLEFFLPERDRDYLIGDFEYIYNDLFQSKGYLQATIWYWFHVIKTIPAFIKSSIYWGGAMFRNYIRIALRNFLKRKIYTTINLLGLSIGVASVIFILLWVNDETSYDSFHEKAERTYRVTMRMDNKGQIIHQTQTAAILADKLKEICPEVEETTRLRGFRRGTIVTVGDKNFNETKHGVADESFFDVFSFNLIKGDPKYVLKDPHTAIISQSAAKKYFGNENPIGKIFRLYEEDFKVTGLYEDMPSNSHFHFDILISFKTLGNGNEGQEWWWNNYKTYVVLREGADTRGLEEQLQYIIRNFIFSTEGSYDKYAEGGNSTTLPIQKITDIHLNSHLIWEFEPNGNGSYVSFLSFIATFILLLAIVNYVNLSTANSSSRAKEIGIRKSIGSTRISLIKQFLVESILTSVGAFIIALGIVVVLLPSFNALVGKPWMSLANSLSSLSVTIFIALSVFVGILSGFYPSLVLSSYQPAMVIRSEQVSGRKKSLMRNVLVVFQFAISIILLVGTIVVSEQMNYTQEKNLGFDKDQVVTIKTMGGVGSKVYVFKNELKKNSSIISVTSSTTVPGASYGNLGSGLEGTGEGRPTNIYGVDDEFEEVYKTELVQGRFFSKEIASDSQAVVITEALAEEWGIKELNGQRMNISINGFTPFNIIGVVKDFHYESFHEKIRPLELVMIPGYSKWNEEYLSIRLNTKDVSNTMRFIQEKWESLLPGIPFEYTFMDDLYNEMYKNEERTAEVFRIFTLLALFIACLGLIGLTSFALEQRTKEIGVRKVLGASSEGLVVRLSGEFTLWVLIATVIASPLAYILMESWLADFAYRIELRLWMFLLAGLGALFVSIITVSVQSIKAANQNPVDSLKCE